MKKIILMMIYLLAFSMTFAQENETEVIDSVTEEEIKAFDIPQGIDLRIEMLKKAIIENIALGEQAINRTLEFNSSLDVSNLIAIIDELKILLNETDLISRENITEAVNDFVSIKKDAKDLISEFKRLFGTLVNEQRRLQIKLEIQERVNQSIAQAIERINNLRKAYKNAYSNRVMTQLGYNNSELVNQFQNGSINATQLSYELRNYYSSLDNETRSEIKENLIQAKNERRAEIAIRVENVINNILNRTIARLTERSLRVQELNLTNGSRIQENIEIRINRTQELRNRLITSITSRIRNGADVE
ncbi:MAG: hypothetical protein PHN56_03020 [Candidatus Nanoarchaeia archaeon]|nr:hypothetical protein [Candidatus Nanoarchaeia archaeon]